MDWRIPLPRIRNINPMPAVHNGQQVYYLQDPLQLSQSSILIPQELGAIFMLCNGTRTLQAVQSALLSIFGIRATHEDMKQLFEALDQAYLLDNKRYRQAYTEVLQAFRQAPYRPATHAGVSYPADPEELSQMLNGFQPIGQAPPGDQEVRGIISPHIDFARGGVTYASTWNDLEQEINDIELAIIFGTDHHGAGEIFSLTHQDYATPFGVLPTFQQGVDMLVEIFGEEAAFAGELRHKTEHSVEFAAVWMHHVRNGNACPILPILCDALPLQEESDSPRPGSEAMLTDAVAGLRELTNMKKTLVIAAGDLSHVGPAFGGKPIEGKDLEELSYADHAYINVLEQGKSDEFYEMILSNTNSTNICGTAPFVHTLNLLAPLSGRLIDYRQCEADAGKTSWVSICGMHFY
jgi:AmmeMemoRadiSam system protein B